MEDKHIVKTLNEFIGEFGISEGLVKWVTYLLSYILLFLKLDIVIILGLLMVVDTIIGIFASYIIGERLKYKRLFIGILTKISILILPLLVCILGVVYNLLIGTHYNFGWFLDFTIIILIANEALSIMANIGTSVTRKRVKNIDYVERLLEIIQTHLTLIVDTVFKVIEKKKK